MTLPRKIKANALLSLKSHWGRAIGVVLFWAGINVMFLLLEYLFILLVQFISPDDPVLRLDFWSGTLEVSSSMAVISVTFLLISFAVLSPLGLGVKKWFTGQISGEAPPILTILDYFYNWRCLFRAIGLRLMVWLRMAAWGLLFAIPSLLLGAGLVLMEKPAYGLEALPVVAMAALEVVVTICMAVLWYFMTLRYYLAGYIFVTDESIGLHAAIRKSAAAMKGGKRILFGLQLSMLPWCICSLFVVPALFVKPYYSASMAIFAKVRLEGYDRKMKQSEENSQ